MSDFLEIILFIEIVIFSLVLAVAPQLVYASFLRNRNIDKFVKYLYSCQNFNIISIDLILTLAKRNKVEDKYIRIVLQELVNTAYAELKNEPQPNLEISLSSKKTEITTIDKLKGSDLVGEDADNSYQLKKFNHFNELLKKFDFEEVFLSLSPDTNRELYQIKDSLSVEHSNTIYRLAERIEELTGQKRKRDRWNLSLTIYSIALTTLGAVASFSQYYDSIVKFFT